MKHEYRYVNCIFALCPSGSLSLSLGVGEHSLILEIQIDVGKPGDLWLNILLPELGTKRAGYKGRKWEETSK